MREILVFTTTLSLGGITSYVINFVNELSKHNKVTLAYTKDVASKLSEISPDVECVAFTYPSIKKTLAILLKHGWIYHALKIKLRRHNQVSPMTSVQRVAFAQAEGTELPDVLLRHYDVVISSAEFYCNDVVALKINASKKIAWIHPDYRAMKLDVNFDRKILDQYSWIAVVSEYNKTALCETIPDYKEKVVYIPNLINKDALNKKSTIIPVEYNNTNRKHIIVTVCRLDNSSKRLDRAVNICKALKDKGEQFLWYIVGDGQDREMLKREIKKNNVEDQMILLGGRSNPYPYIKYADLFVLTSQYEGKPITVDEALILGCPVIVSKYRSASEQVQPEYGTIISNSDDKIISEFCNSLNWEKIKKQREYLEKNDVLQSIHTIFEKNMNNMLNE